MVRFITCLLFLFALFGCSQLGQPIENQACGAFFEDRFDTKLSVPKSSFKTFDEPISLEQLRNSYYSGELTKIEELHFLIFENKELSKRTVFFNGETGVQAGPIQMQGFVCQFLLVDGELYREATIIEDAQDKASKAKTFETLSTLNDNDLNKSISNVFRKRELAKECCMP